jgi:chromosome segregation ATPase
MTNDSSIAADVQQDPPLSEGDMPVMAPVAKENGAGVTDHGTQSTDPDPQAMVIESLRSQIQDLFSQVTQLNNKLVKSYERVSTLEDDLHVASSTVRSSSLKISQLELERSQHLSALNAGILVEKSQVTAELTRLMEKATEEALQRGQAESARADIEKDLDDLSANLFSQANTMVAEARLARAQSERKVEDAEAALKSAEDAVATMQREMQILQEEKDKSVLQSENMRALMGKGKWIEKSPSEGVIPPAHRLRSSHPPYQEFLVFIGHLRLQHHVTPTPPAMSTLLSMPFLVRLVAEESYVPLKPFYL